MLRLPGSLIRPTDSGMAHFHVPIQVSHKEGNRFVSLEALVDTGSTYTWIPQDVLEGLGVVPQEHRPFVLADGRRVRYPVAWINIRVIERTQPTIAVFGEHGSQPILGVVTLEEFLLAVDPVSRQLVPVPGLLFRASPPPSSTHLHHPPPSSSVKRLDAA
jgi:aspartyl protease family protein